MKNQAKYYYFNSNLAEIELSALWLIFYIYEQPEMEIPVCDGLMILRYFEFN